MKRFIVTVLILTILPASAFASRGIEVVSKLESASGRTVGSYRALVIGINEYQDSAIPDLKTAVNDATELSQVLQSTFGFTNVAVLTDGQANESSIIRELRSLVVQSKEDDSVLIYYAGHGELDTLTGSGYWVPHNAKGGDPSTYMNNAVIQQYIKAIPARHVLLVADSCFSGSLFGEARSLPPINNKFYATLYKERSRWGMTSGNLTPVEDAGSGGHSIFAYHFLKELKESDKPYLTPRDIYQRIGPVVRNNSEQMPITQPIKNAGDEGGEFVFIRMASLVPQTSSIPASPVLAPAPAPTPSPAPVPTRQESELDRILREADEKKQQAERDRRKSAERNAEIETYYAKLEDVDKMKESSLPSESKVKVWSEFINQYSTDNPKLEEAQKKLEFWEKMARLPVDERPQIKPPEGMVHIVGSEYTAGADADQGYAKCKKYFARCERSWYTDETPHQETVRSFNIDSYEVTQEQYERVMGKNPSHFKGSNRPVEEVTWHEAKAYCEKIGKRLPTEWEWEFAARAGSTTAYYWGDEYDGAYAWTGNNSDNTTHPVGQKKPNRFGLYDMAGNVWEWTSSNYEGGGKVVLRGGSWITLPDSMRSADRYRLVPSIRTNNFGFRCSQ
ncbi:MAG: hypothetical protein COV66_07570 [Nitrospinae bacterium CG11_big_fil_rev_8_21_14_0_20_45_15]|nr:MAG: hypothetical protein COV66_07570 [Nitrospinae bacterium CG11_big_fil_rev_8_21_14_0_20_45_15]